ncbi:MAG: hypothetical protein HUU16_02615 [Candidatus Omnitrophica bacterium]|nr:hypothetical protein [Candidatus Omnitrophota bacterium]
MRTLPPLFAAALILASAIPTWAQFGSAPMTPGASAPQATTPTSAPAPPAPSSSGPVPIKWYQHDTGYVVAVPSDQNLGPGFREIQPPSSSAAAPSVATAPPAPVSAPVSSAQTYSQPTSPQPSGPAVAFSQAPAPYSQQSFSQPYSTPLSQPQTQPSTAGKKWMQHKSGYRVIVDANTTPGPEFVEIPPPNTTMGTPYGAPQTPAMPQASAFSQPQAAPTGPQTYSQIPMSGGYTPARPMGTGAVALPNLPPNMQRQLPYQPPTPAGVPPAQPTYQAPTGYNPAYGTGQRPTVRSAPPGKKWVQQDNGMRFLVDANTIPGPGFRELTDEEASQPLRIMDPRMQQQQQQQPQQQGFGSGFRNWISNLGRR